MRKRVVPRILSPVGAGVALLIAGTILGQSPAGAAVAVGTAPAPGTAGPVNFSDLSYILTMRSGGIEFWDKIPRDLQQDVGYSLVDMLHDIGQPQGRCETDGAAYWLSQAVEEGVLGKGAAPPDAGNVSGGYRNPTISRDVEPNLSAGSNLSNRHPAIANYFPPGNDIAALPPAGPGYHWTAQCADDTHGKAQGDDVNVAGIQAVGSTTEAALDKTTGVYTGTSRSYVFGISGAKGFDSASSFMQVVNKPNQPATITYRMSYFNSSDKTNKNGITFGGEDIPLQQFADSFNAQARTVANALSAVGPAGVATLQPEVGVSTDGDRYAITISAAHGHLGLNARQGGLGGDQGMRLGSITFEGAYGDAN